MLRALQDDENSIPLNHDYVFYPQLSPELINLSTRCSAPIGTMPQPELIPAVAPSNVEEVGRPPSLPIPATVCAGAVDRGNNFGIPIFYCG